VPPSSSALALVLEFLVRVGRLDRCRATSHEDDGGQASAEAYERQTSRAQGRPHGFQQDQRANNSRSCTEHLPPLTPPRRASRLSPLATLALLSRFALTGRPCPTGPEEHLKRRFGGSSGFVEQGLVATECHRRVQSSPLYNRVHDDAHRETRAPRVLRYMIDA